MRTGPDSAPGSRTWSTTPSAPGTAPPCWPATSCANSSRPTSPGHLDIQGTALSDTDDAEWPAGATGFDVRALAELLTASRTERSSMPGTAGQP
ncbi:hypothetical protein [Kitasatospora sp. NPDC001683]